MKRFAKYMLPVICAASLPYFVHSSLAQGTAEKSRSANIKLNLPAQPMNGTLLGTVRYGQFRILAPTSERGKVYERFNDISPYVATLPKPVSLAPYEGKTILMAGQEHGGALWSARVLGEVTESESLIIRQSQHIIEQNEKIITLLSTKR